jgi:hypothetical protein
MDQEAVRAVLNDLRSDLNDATAAHAFACLGLQRLPDVFAQVPRVPENPDPEVLIGVGDPNTREARTYASWPLSKASPKCAERAYGDPSWASVDCVDVHALGARVSAAGRYSRFLRM